MCGEFEILDGKQPDRNAVRNVATLTTGNCILQHWLDRGVIDFAIDTPL